MVWSYVAVMGIGTTPVIFLQIFTTLQLKIISRNCMMLPLAVII